MLACFLFLQWLARTAFTLCWKLWLAWTGFCLFWLLWFTRFIAVTTFTLCWLMWLVSFMTIWSLAMSRRLWLATGTLCLWRLLWLATSVLTLRRLVWLIRAFTMWLWVRFWLALWTWAMPGLSTSWREAGVMNLMSIFFYRLKHNVPNSLQVSLNTLNKRKLCPNVSYQLGASICLRYPDPGYPGSTTFCSVKYIEMQKKNTAI